MPDEHAVLGIFVGGRARRMGGVQKALLRAPDTGETLVARLARLGAESGLEVVLVGAAELGPAYAQLPRLLDAPSGVGPLGGLSALLAHAAPRAALAVACDMPYLSASLLARLAHAPNTAGVLAPRDPDTGKWQSLFARYQAARVLPTLEAALAQGQRSFQALFRHLDVQVLELSQTEHAQLRDWDRPEDITPLAR